MTGPQASIITTILLLLLGASAAAQGRLEADGIIIHHPDGMAGAARRVADSYADLLHETEVKLGFPYGQKVRVWIERDHEAFDRRIVAFGGAPRPDHVAAVAFPMHDLIILKSAAWLRGDARAFEVTLQHEIAHCVLGRLRRSHPGIDLPVWLDEGLAQWVSETQLYGSSDLIAQAIRRDELIPFEKLRRDFPEQEGASALAYAQSLEIVRYLAAFENPKGRKRNVQGLLLALADGLSLDAAVRQQTGMSLHELESAWRGDARAILPISLRQLPEVLFAFMLVVLALLAYAVARVRRENRLAELAAADAREIEEERVLSRLEQINERWRHEEGPTTPGKGPEPPGA